MKKSRIHRINGFMIKPPTPEELVQRIRQTLGL